MASSSISNLFSFFSLSKPPPTTTLTLPPPPQLPQTTTLPSLSTSHLTKNNNHHHLVPPPSHDVLSVVCPSLAYANTLYFRSAYNVQVIVDDNEPEEKLLNRFRREVMRAGVVQECKRRRYFETKQDKEKRKTREAAKRNRKRRPFSRNFTQDKQQEISKSKRDDDEKDNWDLPEGELPY
ncbi:hypothetical protein Leryth_017854 [Lithospermum erythrorhizon]|nr:hypothetical protein Leryth_017854 [Lithospermum erythrorhizon]